MACFIAPAAEAVVTTVATHLIKTNEAKNADIVSEEMPKVTLSHKLGWLNKMLWGGSALLAFEHLWHGEVSPVFPFLTAVANGETQEMLNEIGTNGVTMAVLVTAVWAGIVLVSNNIEKNATKDSAKENV